ncbi:hypothetical protein DWU98_16105 [Dyella monticola]|uniref:MASE1 domain-containing protein n=1 Tax=Dyella monticola TaxID=1927958 RepID=A0A370WV33_9GAMM|nr:MASE1 domain-containing protein [Dyella monticola]RDS79960.1 hypothetical protein DWU98_16105 [Dyella monticola]
MLKSIVGDKWLRQVAVFAAYCAAYMVLRPWSNGIWGLTDGLRLSALLLLPYRYWPTLALAEIGPLIYYNHADQAQLGLTWVIGNCIPPILYAMPVVAWCRRGLALFPARHVIRAKALLICVVVSAVVWTVTTVPLLLVVVQPPGTPHPYHFHSMQILQLFLGRYTGILTILPMALVFKLRKPQHGHAHMLAVVKSSLTLEFLALLLPALILLYWLNLQASADIRPVIRMAMFLPTAWLTTRHGWRAAALGTTATLICIVSDMASRADNLDVLGMQAFIAFSVTCLFALGSRSTAEDTAGEQEHMDAKTAIKLAQQGMYFCELRMRQASQTLEQVSGTLQLTQARLLNRFKNVLLFTEDQSYYKQMAATQIQVHQAVESMHPTAWREGGLPAALRETIGLALEEAGVAYRFELKGRGLSRLSRGLHAAIYRLACEVVVYVFAWQAWSTITVSLRGGFTHGQRWVTLRIQGYGRAEAALPMHRKEESQYLAAKLGANSLSVMAMRDYARLYNGELHTYNEPHTFRITALMHDVSQQVQGSHATTPAPLELYLR